MPSRAYTSFLLHIPRHHRSWNTFCVNALSGLYLISTYLKIWSKIIMNIESVNALSGLYLISTRKFLGSRVYGQRVSMPSRAYTSFLRYPFKNLGFMRFPEPVFAGIYQNILTTAVFRAC